MQHARRSRPASLAASSTALPKPPASAPSSTVTTNGQVLERLQDRVGSSGLTKRALTTPTSKPFFAQDRGGLAGKLGSSVPQRQDHAVVAPVEDLGLAQLDRRPRSSSTVFGWPWGSGSTTGRRGTEAKSSIGASDRARRRGP